MDFEVLLVADGAIGGEQQLEVSAAAFNNSPLLSVSQPLNRAVCALC